MTIDDFDETASHRRATTMADDERHKQRADALLRRLVQTGVKPDEARRMVDAASAVAAGPLEERISASIRIISGAMRRQGEDLRKVQRQLVALGVAVVVLDALVLALTAVFTSRGGR